MACDFMGDDGRMRGAGDDLVLGINKATLSMSRKMNGLRILTGGRKDNFSLVHTGESGVGLSTVTW